MLIVLVGICLHGHPVAAQRVAFPSSAPAPTTTFAAPTTPVAPAYPPTSPGVPAYPPTTPVTPTSAPTLPPAFDPYQNSSLGAPPPDVPYAAPMGSPTPYPPQGAAPPFPGTTPPVGWEQGTYQYQNPDGSSAQLQRLLQQIDVEYTWMAGGSSDNDLGLNRLELDTTLGFPICYNPETPLLVTPGFAFNWLSGPKGEADLPPVLYDAYLDFAWFPQLSDWFSFDLGFRTGVWSDFEVINSNSVRFMGRGVGVMKFTPKFDFRLGVWYLDRNEVKLLPVVGVLWRPTPEWDVFAVFPNPKIRKRFHNLGTSQWWWYVAGEYGGGRWSIKRDEGQGDNIDINDLRLILGFEWETQTQLRGHVEVGYVWDREILYTKNPPPKFDLNDTVMIRVGFDF
jgi:hypothetical protein